MARDIAESKVARLEDEVGKAAELKDRNLSLSKCLEEVYRANARADMRRKRDRLALDSVRLGKFRTVQTGHTSVMETFEDGFALKELSVRSMELLQQKEELDRRRKRLASQRRIAKKEEGDIDLDHDLATEAEALKAHAEQQKRDEVSLADERRLLEGEKEGHKKELRRVDCEDRSRFTKDLPCLNGRYILTSILGRGGFSEVWRAFDLVERRDVAIKVHQLNPGWTEERKESYIRHVRREYTIHKDMQHPRIVQLFDVFEIDINSFATVMELCRCASR
jgi:tousled-like kinase